MTATDTPVNNGVNVEALLGAWEALTEAPEAAKFAVASHLRVAERHAQQLHGRGLLRPRRGAEPPHPLLFDLDHPEIFASEDNGATPVEYVLVGLAGCLTAGVAAVAEHREIQLRRVTATIEGDMDVRGILGMDSDVRNGFSGIKVTYDIDADATPPRSRRSSRSRRSARRCTTSSPTPPTSGSRSADPTRWGRPRAHHDRRHRRGARWARDQPCLSERSIDHVVLERSQVANSWRSERWDSLRLLTPNWQCRLPGYAYRGRRPRRVHDDAGGRRLHHRLCEGDRGPGAVRHDGDVGAPHRRRVLCHDRPGRVAVPDGRARIGRVQRAAVPDVSEAVPASVTTLTPMEYRNPGELAEGGVLVVGASATGVQIAHEIQRSGRPVTLAVGEHVRGPRVYRGRDIHWWMEAAGVLDERYDEVDDIVRARRVPSMQLAGSPERTTFDLNALTASG